MLNVFAQIVTNLVGRCVAQGAKCHSTAMLNVSAHIGQYTKSNVVLSDGSTSAQTFYFFFAFFLFLLRVLVEIKKQQIKKSNKKTRKKQKKSKRWSYWDSNPG
jgi:large-conductance mechanosensitive channel